MKTITDEIADDKEIEIVLKEEKKEIEEMNFKPSEHKDVMQKLNNIIQELEELKDDNYWAYTKEYWMGLLDCSLIMLKKVKEDME